MPFDWPTTIDLTCESSRLVCSTYPDFYSFIFYDSDLPISVIGCEVFLILSLGLNAGFHTFLDLVSSLIEARRVVFRSVIASHSFVSFPILLISHACSLSSLESLFLSICIKSESLVRDAILLIVLSSTLVLLSSVVVCLWLTARIL